MNSIINHVVGKAFCLPGNNIDTDRIIPARFLKCVTFDGLGAHVFEDDRAKLDGNHPFDLPENKGRSILVVDENFGSGSSREHAVHALMRAGIKAIIGLSFAEIFRGNAVGNGLVCVELSKERHDCLMTFFQDGFNQIKIDLDGMMITAADQSESPMVLLCDMPDSHRNMLITGEWDSLAIAMEAGPLIEETAARLPYMASVA